jgi:hypothetical protein
LLAGTAIDAVVGIYVELAVDAGDGGNAVHGTDGHARLVVVVDARFGYDVCHEGPPAAVGVDVSG